MADLTALFRPRGVAVIGASIDPGKMGSLMLRSLEAFDGPVAGINERVASREDGLFPSVSDARDETGASFDLAILCIPAGLCPDALDRAARGGVRAAVVCAGGFAEVDEAGAIHQARLAEVAARHGVRLLGPNTSGFLVPHHGLQASFVPGVSAVSAGGIGVVAASGGVNHALAFRIAEAGYGVSVAVGLGNAVDVTTPDVLDHLADDPETRVVALHIESVTQGARLLDAVRRTVPLKPVVALVVGRSDVGDFARSHTGALATAWRTTRALLAQSGAVLVDDERELVDAAAQLAQTRLAPSPAPGVALVTGQAGPGLLVMDELRTRGVAMPPLADTTQSRLGSQLPPMTYQANPVDTGRPGETFGDVLATVADDRAIDVVAVYALAEPDAVDLAVAVSAAAGEGRAFTVATGGTTFDTRPVRDKLIAESVAVHGSPTALAVGVWALVADARARHGAEPGAGTVTGAARVAARVAAQVSGRDGWDEHDAKQVLDALGIATPRRIAYRTLAAATGALAELSGPLAVKILDAHVLHKTDIGGVHLGVRSGDELAAVLTSLQGVGATRVLVEEMAPAGVDLIVGARRDPVFGPVVLVGLGGTIAEALADVAIGGAPLSVSTAAGLADQLLGADILRGWRGGPVLDPQALGRIVASLGQVLIDHPHLEEIEINPLRLTRQGLIALDAVITTRSSDDQPH
jgi:acyl-CoA synthetase (NDP forming)